VLLLVIRTYRPFYRSRPGRMLAVSTGLAVGLTLALPYLPLAGIFDLVPLSGTLLGSVVAITAAYVVVTDYLKRGFYDQVGTAVPGGARR
jgi:Mg2+-importing ATPase